MKLKSVVLLSFFASIFYSPTLHAQWTPAGLQGISLSALTVNGGDVFAGGNFGGGIYRSTDNGSTWFQTNTGLFDKNIVTLGGNASLVLAATDTEGIFISTNNGLQWNVLSGWKIRDSVRQFAFLGTEIFVATTRGGVFRSTDEGVNWIAVNNGLLSLHLRGLISDGINLYANSADARIFRSSDHGNTWINASQGLPSIGLNAMMFDGSALIGANQFGLYRSVNFGRAWINLHAVDTTFAQPNYPIDKYAVYSITSSDSGIIVGTSGGVYRTIDLGLHWTRPSEKNADVGIYGTGVNFLVNIGTYVIAGTTTGISRSTDYGVSWHQKSTDVHPFGPGQNHTVNCIALIGTNLFAGIDNGGFPHSSDDGVNWIPSNGLSNNKVNAFANLGSNYFVGTDTAGVFLSSDNGINWTTLYGMTNSYPVGALAVSGSAIFAATIGGGVFRSNDTGKSWIPVTPG